MSDLALDQKLKEIITSITLYANDRMKTQDAYEDFGLFNGHWGMLLFEAYYLHYNDKCDFQRFFDEHLDFCLTSLSDGYQVYSYSNGLCGMLLALEHLQKKEFIEIDISEAIDVYDNLFKQILEQELQNPNYDFLHGIIGLGFYFLHRNNVLSISCIENIIKHLWSDAIINGEQYAWKTILNLSGIKAFNICLSHGMSSIAVFLARVYEKSILKDQTFRLLQGCIRFILAQEIDYKKYGSYFPSITIEYEQPDILKSRMGWCYGDLGVALSLWQCGKILHDDCLKMKSLEILRFSTRRKLLEENSVFDACLCHGTSGIAQIFLRMYYETGITSFLESNKFWVSETLKMAQCTNNVAGFRTLEVKQSKLNYFDNYSFLEGISGIGLSLMASNLDIHFSDWDAFLLMK